MVSWIPIAAVIVGGGAYLLGLCNLLTFINVLIVLLVLRYTIFSQDCDLTTKYYELFGKRPEHLRGKVVWITGASSGIGAALAVRLARAGTRLALSARSTPLLDAVKEQCVATGGVSASEVLVVPLDLTQCCQHNAAFDNILEHFGEIDVLVNNAGRSQRAQWHQIDVSVDKALFDLDVFGTVALSRVVLRYFLDQGRCGAFVVTSSVAGKFGVPMSAAYTGAKHALHGYFESLRTEMIGRRISVILLCAGPFVSNLTNVCFTGKLGEVLGEERIGNKLMDVNRCAELYAIAIANSISESWVTLQPILAMMYLAQYFPTITKSVMQLIPLSVIMKLRDGKSDITSKTE